MTKQAYREQAFDDSMDDCLTTAGPDGIAVRISGLTHVRDDIFRIQGVKPRKIDWGMLFRAIDEPDDGTVNERLVDAISSAIRRQDLIVLLSERMLVD